MEIYQNGLSNIYIQDTPECGERDTNINLKQYTDKS